MVGLKAVRPLHFAFGSAVLILLAVGAFCDRGLDASIESGAWVSHTHEVLENLQLMRLSMASIEASGHRYLLTGAKADLDASRGSMKGADDYVAILRGLTADNPVQQGRMPELQALLDEKRHFLGRVFLIREASGEHAAMALIEDGVGQKIMARSQAAILRMQDEERRLLRLRAARAKQLGSQTKWVLVLGNGLALLITFGAGWLTVRSSIRRQLAETELERMNVELRLSNDELERFAYVASHDLQEPLRTTQAFLTLISKQYRGQLDAQAGQFIDLAVDGASRMQSLIQDLLSYSVVGKAAANLVITSSEEALERAVTNLRSAIGDAGALVTHDPLPAVLAEAPQLTQLFQNLIGNAIKYQSPGIPRVHISAVKNAEKRWLFSVADNGLGIEPQYFEKIFEMFQRLHGRSEFSGTGIGLAICKKIVERHGGVISVASQPGEGSVFSFALAGPA